MKEATASESVLLTTSAAEKHFVTCAGLRYCHKIQLLGKVFPETAANRKNFLLGIKLPKILYAVFLKVLFVSTFSTPRSGQLSGQLSIPPQRRDRIR